jgi:hypothetical protein
MTKETTYTFAKAAEEFAQAWRDPHHTRIELPAVDVNKALAERYIVDAPIHVTLSMVWDMELKKSWDPITYIPYVVSDGKSWGRHPTEAGCEHFFRSSIQRAWIGDENGRVLEDVHINHAAKRILFMGRASMITDGGEIIRADKFQPLFHVEHAAGGSETAPLNLWRIVILTENEDKRLLAPFQKMIREGGLPGFLEIYIRKDLKVNVSRRESTERAL